MPVVLNEFVTEELNHKTMLSAGEKGRETNYWGMFSCWTTTSYNISKLRIQLESLVIMYLKIMDTYRSANSFLNS